MAIAMMVALAVPHGVYAEEKEEGLLKPETGGFTENAEGMALASNDVGKINMPIQDGGTAEGEFALFASPNTEDGDISEPKEMKESGLLSDAEISDSTRLLEILQYTNETETIGKSYVLTKDITITEDAYSQLTIGNDTSRVFAGTLNGDNHTITVAGDGGPLFETLRGSVSNLKLVFEGNVKGAPFAIDAGASKGQDGITLKISL